MKAPLVSVGTCERRGIFDLPHKRGPFVSRNKSNGPGQRRSDRCADVALRVEENNHLIRTTRVNGVRSVRGGEHAGSLRPPTMRRSTDQEITRHRENEMHRVMRMQRPAHPGAANGKQRWPGLNEESRRDQRQRHVANISGPRNATVGREEYPSCAEHGLHQRSYRPRLLQALAAAGLIPDLATISSMMALVAAPAINLSPLLCACARNSLPTSSMVVTSVRSNSTASCGRLNRTALLVRASSRAWEPASRPSSRRATMADSVFTVIMSIIDSGLLVLCK